MNINRIDELEKSVEEIENNVKGDLISAFLANGKIKTGRRTSKTFDEEVVSEMRQLKTDLANTKPKLGVLGRRASNLFQVDFRAFERNPGPKKNRTSTAQQNERQFVHLRGSRKF